MSGDVGRHALAQRYHIQALDLALWAGDRRYAADILAEASRLTVRIGENAPAGQDTLRHGRQAVALARAGLNIAQDAATPALAAKLHAMQAPGFRPARRCPRGPRCGGGGAAVLRIGQPRGRGPFLQRQRVRGRPWKGSLRYR